MEWCGGGRAKGHEMRRPVDRIASDRELEASMQFRLIYRGPLRATQKDPYVGQVEPPARAKHKHTIRQAFHAQLKELWATNTFLRTTKLPKEPLPFPGRDFAPMAEVLAGKYQQNGYRFVPLVREELTLLCSLDILFLRRDIPGGVITAGDIDNRLKTLIDALRMPKNSSELVGSENPEKGEDPFYCLLEDDKGVTKLSVETDTLLDQPDSDDPALVHLVIRVDVRPYHVCGINHNFL